MRTPSPAQAVIAILVVLVAVATALGPRARAADRRRFATFDAEAKALLARMTLDEKVGQMTQAEQHQLKDVADIRTYFLGSLLSGGSSDPKTNSLQDWTDLYDRFQKETQGTRLKIPILYGIDAVHGHNNVIGAVVFPHNIGLGATRDAALVEEIGRVTASEVRATGIQWTFAPCVAVVRDERWGRTYESYSEDPALVAELGAAAVRGLQGDLADPLRILACAKHYVGDGGTTWGTGMPKRDASGERYPLDQGDTRLSESDLRRLHLPGYVKAVEAGVGSIMPSYSSWNGEKVSGSRRLLTEVLKEELGFEGFLISDYNAIDQLPGDRRAQVKQSINAGMDMAMVLGRLPRVLHDAEGARGGGRGPDVPHRRRGHPDPAREDRDGPHGSRPQPARRPIAAEGLRLARAPRRGPPGGARVARAAEERASTRCPSRRRRSGSTSRGRTRTTSGTSAAAGRSTGRARAGRSPRGTTILAALRRAAGKDTEVTYAEDGAGAAGADVGVVVVGETPYAEMDGDRADLALGKEDLDAITAVKKAGIPVVVVVVSGRPLILGDALRMADAVVAAWLPGHGGRRRGRRALRGREADGQALVHAGRAPWGRSRSTWATRGTTRCSRSGSA